ncbi:hypothetical protein [Phenylobacterium sp.]|uniref:hypothetical protein n=1 Tax=Phenylobacterium sp. TaxID=1871053 RepID=UPI002DEBB98E|nr:hypothetical protein [Phenylobacterium sp.]
MATLDDIYPRKLDLGRVAERTVWVLGRQPLMIFGLALLLYGVPAAGSMMLANRWLDIAEPFGVFHHPTFWGAGLVSLLIAAFLEVSLLAVTMGELGGRAAAPGEVVLAGLKFMLPLFAVNLFYLLGVCVGLVLLVVPGIMLALAWCVAAPALLVERSGITEVFGRSADLTRDNRWRLLGLFLIAAVASSIIGGVGGGHAYGYHYRWSGFPFEEMILSPTRIVIAAVLKSLAHAVAVVALGVIYVELRSLKEGAAPADLGQVFD